MERVQSQFLICRKSGYSLAPLASFLPMLCASGMLGQHWHHIGLMLSHLGFFGVCVSAHVAPSWAILGSVLAFVLNFRPCKAFAKHTLNAEKKHNFWAALLMVFAAIFGLLLFLFFGACCT